MLPEIESIKKRRMNLNLKQKDLSERAKVSQSLIAKIEPGRTSPSYETVQKIFNALDNAEHKNEKTCNQIVSAHLITVSFNNSIGKAAKIMHEKNISQLPIMKGNHTIGSISEGAIAGELFKGTKKETLWNMKVTELMQEPFPTVAPETPIKTIFPLLKVYEAILVTKKGKVSGIITKSDIIS